MDMSEAFLSKIRTTLLVERRWRYLRYLHLREAILLVRNQIETCLVVGAGKGLAELALAVEFPNIDFHLTDIETSRTPNWQFTQNAVNEWGLHNVRFSILDVLKPAGLRADLVCSTEVLEHLPQAARAADNMIGMARRFAYCLVPFADREFNANEARRKRVLEQFGHYVCGFDEAELVSLFPDPVETRGCYWADGGQRLREELERLPEEEIRVRRIELETLAQSDITVGCVPRQSSEASGIWTLARV